MREVKRRHRAGRAEKKRKNLRKRGNFLLQFRVWFLL